MVKKLIQVINSIPWVLSLWQCFEYAFSDFLQINSKFGHRVTSLALFGSKVGHQAVPLALPHCNVKYLRSYLQKTWRGGRVTVEIFWGDIWDPCQKKNLKIAFLTVTPFIVKFRFEKYRYLLTHLQCLQIFEVLLSDNHSSGPRNVSAVSAFAFHVWWYCHFVPKYMLKVNLIRYWMPNILSEKVIHWENGGLREAFLTKIS